MLVQRRFHVSLQDKQPISEAGKRILPGVSTDSLQKRAKVVQDETGVIIQQQKPNLELSKSLDQAILDGRIVVHDLEDGQTAVIRRTVKDQIRTKQGQQALGPYELTRIDGIAQNPSTTVLTCSHSGIDVPSVVAKVLRYGNIDEGIQLASCASFLDPGDAAP